MYCPKNLDIPPGNKCTFGKNKECKWYVLDSQSNYCMWYWIVIKKDGKGSTFEEVGKLVGKTGARIHQEMKVILNKIKNSFEEGE